MRFGLAIPTCREGISYEDGFAAPQALSDITAAAQDLGYDAVWANQHLVTQHAVAATSETAPRYYDPIVTLAYLAARFPNIRLVLASLIAPAWSPVPLAKLIATLDQLSGGRVTLGLGIGSYPEEVEAVLQQRGRSLDRSRRLEEIVGALRTLFSDEIASFAGKRYSFSNLSVSPKPVQRPMPIHIAANSRAGVARAGTLADGWITAGKSPAQISADLPVLYSAAEDAGRRPADIEVCTQLWVSIADTDTAARENCQNSRHFQRMKYLTKSSDKELMRSFEESNLVGTPAQVAVRLSEYADVGVHHAALVFVARDPAEAILSARILADEVIPNIRIRTASAPSGIERR